MGHGHGGGGSQVVGRSPSKCPQIAVSGYGAARPYAARPAVDPHLARPAAPSRTIQPASALTRTGQPDPRHICTLAVALSMCPHTHGGVHDRTLGPKRMHSHRAGARPCAWPRASASPPELPRSASNWHLPHHSATRAVQHLSSTARRRSALDCTAYLRSSSRARLPMHLFAPLRSAHGTSQYALRGSLCAA